MSVSMFCCKRSQSCHSAVYMKAEHSENEEEEEDEVMIAQSRLDLLEIKEWKMQLRENNICMDECNLRMKKQKLRDIEENAARQRKASEQEIEERERELELQRRQLEEEMKKVDEAFRRKRGTSKEEHELAIRQENMKEKDFEVTEKNAILEITLKMNKREEKMAIELNKSKANKANEQDREQLRARSIEIEEREQELVHQQESLDERELKLEEKNMIMEIAFRINDFR